MWGETLQDRRPSSLVGVAGQRGHGLQVEDCRGDTQSLGLPPDFNKWLEKGILLTQLAKREHSLIQEDVWELLFILGSVIMGLFLLETHTEVFMWHLRFVLNSLGNKAGEVGVVQRLRVLRGTGGFTV